jgi:homoserine dehydrogenase
MQQVNVGIIGLGNVGSGALAILTENADQIALKLGFQLRVRALCSRSITVTKLTAADSILRTTDWREVVAHPEVDIVAELVGGTTVAREIIDGAIEHRKSVVTANKELMALCGAEIWDRAIARRHFGRPRDDALRHLERHQQLHPYGNREARLILR